MDERKYDGREKSDREGGEKKWNSECKSRSPRYVLLNARAFGEEALCVLRGPSFSRSHNFHQYYTSHGHINRKMCVELCAYIMLT